MSGRVIAFGMVASGAVIHGVLGWLHPELRAGFMFATGLELGVALVMGLTLLKERRDA